MRKGEPRKAWEVIVENNPLAFTCGTVCPHPCEAACNRREFDEALSIREVERFLGEEAIRRGWLLPKVVQSQQSKIAVIGSGPAGLSCAYQLGKRGYQVTIFEVLPVIGGMLQVGIQDYRLPRDIFEREVHNNVLSPHKIELRTNCLVDKDVFQEIRQEFQVVFVATGATKGRKLKAPGVDLGGVYYGVDLLRERALDKLPAGLFQGKRVLVIGGGGVAVDAARSALRLAAKEVALVCLESRKEMPAYEWDIEDAVKEGVQIEPSWGTEELLGNGVRNVKEISLTRCTSVFDAEGRFNPSLDRSVKKKLPADAVIIAVGQISCVPFLDEIAQVASGEKAKVDDSLRTSVAGVFAGGDAVTEPATVIEAIAAGKKAAISINNYLQNQPSTIEEKSALVVEFEELNLAYFRRQARKTQVHNGSSAMEEANRCFSCGYCNLCGNCWAFCPDIAISLEEECYAVDYDYCKGCGICSEECPTRALGIRKEQDVEKSSNDW